MTLDQLYEIAAARGIEIDDVPMRELRAVSFPQGWIAIDRRKFSSDTDYKCALAHEIGHCETSSFYRDGANTHDRDLYERHADRYAAELLLPLSDILRAMHGGMLLPSILAQMHDVTLEFANMVLELYEKEICTAARIWIAAKNRRVI